VGHPLQITIIGRLPSFWSRQLDDLETRSLAVAAAGAALDPFSVRFLLARYRASDRHDLGEALGLMLARAFDAPLHTGPLRQRTAWLAVAMDSLALTDDARAAAAADAIVATLEQDWMSAGTVEARAIAIDACLSAVERPPAHALAPAAIDALEHIVAHAYRPGDAMAHAIDGVERGNAGDQIHTAAALLTAYELSGRLPYPMLAEELVQYTLRRGLLTGDAGPPTADCRLPTVCAARVLVGLAALHDDEAFRNSAVLTPGADYRADAARLLREQSTRVAAGDAHSAIYALALIELESAFS
jgi:hypothetical protein